MSEVSRCWAVSDGRAGMENQALGLAEAVAREVLLDIEVKRIALRRPYKWFPTEYFSDPFQYLADPRSLDGVTPDLWIGCGRVTVPFGRVLRSRYPTVFTVQCQDPRCPPGWFDLVIPPKHDNLEGENVFSITGAPSRITRFSIETAMAKIKPYIPPAQIGKRLGLSIGGDSKAYKMTGAVTQRLMGQLHRLAGQGYLTLVSTSRRTEPNVTRLLRRGLTGNSFMFIEDLPAAVKDIGYHGMLGMCDQLLVTEESTNMITDAAITGKPVHLIPLEGRRGKFDRFHRQLTDMSITRTFDPAHMTPWSYRPLDETTRAAKEIVHRWVPQGEFPTD